MIGIVGLGNPGPEYANTRHNAGVLLVEKIFSVQYSVFNDNYGWRRQKNIFVAKFPDLVLIKSAGVFMNESGHLISNFKFQISNFYLAHDDLDLKLGEYKIQFGKGPRDHGGINSIEQTLKTKDFWRIRIGVDNRAGERESRRAGEEYVLEKFTAEEREVLDGVLEKICNQLAVS